MRVGWLPAALAATAAISVAVAIWQSQRLTKLEGAAAAVLAEKESARLRAEKAERENAELRALAGMPPAADPPASPAAPGRRVTSSPADLESVRIAAQLRDSLKEANAAISELELRSAQLEEKLKKGADENQRLSGEAQELRDRVDSTVRLVDALQTEMRTRNERLAQLEAANKGLREQNAGAADRTARTQQALREAEEINRRRETYLTSLTRRFRELTDQYRSLAVRMDSPGEGPVAVPGELSRIQSVVAMAEEDLKQISNLNAQAARAMAKLPK